MAAQLSVVLEPHPVTLHYPGAEGVRFQDAVLVLGNTGDAPAANVTLRLNVVQGASQLFDDVVALPALGLETTIEAGGTLRVSVFRALQHHVLGFGSKVNMFGYKAVLNWAFRVEATLGSDQTTAASGTWNLEWRPSADDPGLVEVEIGDE